MRRAKRNRRFEVGWAAAVLAALMGMAGLRCGTITDSENDSLARVLYVTSSDGSGTRMVGESVSIKVNFSTEVTVTGTPTLKLETGESDRVINYLSGSGTTSLSFEYLIYPGEQSTELDYASTAALTAGTAITDPDGKTAVTTLPSPGSTDSLSARRIAVSASPSISVGAYSSCYVLSSGALKCWGQNTYGQLGLGHSNAIGDGTGEMGSNLPSVNLGTGRTAKQISAGWNHACALLDNGSVKCWGQNTYGQLGQGHTNHLGDGSSEMGDNLSAIDLGTSITAKMVSAGGHFSCALLSDSRVKCWGRNHYGQLGQGHANHLGDGTGEMGDGLPAVDFGSNRTVKQVSAGTYHACVLLDDNSVKCWGYNVDGQLGQGHVNRIGDGPNEMGGDLSAIDLGAGKRAKQVSAGSCHSCALLDDNSIKCWGNNESGQLGQGNANDIGDGANELGDTLAALSMGAGCTVRQVVTGFDVTCALLDNATVKCWGVNAYGQLGLGHTNNLGDGANEMGDNLATVSLGTGRSVKQISSGNWSYHTCALLDNDAIKCWGRNNGGQLGQGHTDSLGDATSEMGDSLAAIDVGS